MSGGDVWILGGARADFARNYAREGREVSDLVADGVHATLEAAGVEPSDKYVFPHVRRVFGDAFARAGIDGVVKADPQTGAEQPYPFGEGVFGSETPMAPRPQGSAEDDGYLITFTTDMVRDCECLVLDATDIAAGPIARARNPERISSGTHSCWAPVPA